MASSPDTDLMAPEDSSKPGGPQDATDPGTIRRTRPLRSQITRFFEGPWDLVAVATMGIFVLALVGFLYFARPFLMPCVLALLLNFLFKPVVRAMARAKIPEWIGAIVVLVAFVSVLVLGISRITQPALDWAGRAPDSLKQVERKIREVLHPASQLTRAAEQVEDMTKSETEPRAPRVELKRFNLADSLVSYTTSFFATALETIVLLYFLLVYSDLFLRKTVGMLTSEQDQQQVVGIAHEIQTNISSYLSTITVINTCLGILVGVGMWIVGMPNAVLWGVLAGFLNFIPYFGPLTGVIVLTLAGFLTFETTGKALAPPIIYLSFHTVEANFITPTVLGRRLTLNPVVIFGALIFWMWLWGVIGALLAVPLLMLTKILCDHVKPLRAIGEFLSGEPRAGPAAGKRV